MLLALGLFAGCEPTCKQTCDKLLECEEVETPRLSPDECESQCAVQEQVYEDFEDTVLREAFADAKRCVDESECADIADGACYDETLFAW